MLQTLLTSKLLHTTDKYIKALNKWGVFSIFDFINIYPKDFEDRTNILTSFSYINVKEKNTILLKLLQVENQRTSNNKLLTKAIFEDKNWFMREWIWFNRKFLASMLDKKIGQKLIVTWKVKYEYWKLTFLSPEIDLETKNMSWSIVPIYSDLNYIPWSWISQKMHLLRKYMKLIDETLPEVIIKKYNFYPKSKAIESLHFPQNFKDLELARKRLAYEELYNINYNSLLKKYNKLSNLKNKSIPIKLNPETIKNILKKIPFSLTDWQKITLFQILKDMEKKDPMQRLLEWDVGTWKTIVAAIAVIHSILESKNISKIQACIMTPTEILALQHFEWLTPLFESFWLKVELLVWSTRKKHKNLIKEYLKTWYIDVVIWTHALIQDDVYFNNLWFVVIDEQHRFWVKQREILEKWFQNISQVVPHNLNMTATPIPRTLALTIYWDQDISILKEYPVWRKMIYTKVVNDKERKEVELFIRNQIESGRQVFWISPLVEESEKIDLANAVSIYESLCDIFYPFKVWLLHWKMKSKEKEKIMNDFINNKISILSSTSVVEVWINIPNATIICIEWAERFWLSQLHQFRWRVWRWEYQSYCFLFPTLWQKTDRLKAMEKTNNWFELAEIDLELRWPWEVYWVKQSWVPEFKIAKIQDLELISQIREDIEDLILKK